MNKLRIHIEFKIWVQMLKLFVIRWDLSSKEQRHHGGDNAKKERKCRLTK